MWPEAFDWESDLHFIKTGEEWLLLDVNSASLHLLDEMAYQFLMLVKKHEGNLDAAESEAREYLAEDEISEVRGEIEALARRGEIFASRQEEGLELLTMPVKALCLNVAHACNMACTYCFAQKGDFGGKAGLMTHEVAERAIDFLIAKSEHVHNLEIDFFGGEPLLAWDVVTDTVAYARSREKGAGKHFSFTLTTNGILLTEDKMDYIIDNNISVILSLDGRPETNDRHRILRDGSGSYERLVPIFRNMVARKPISYYIRGTFTRENLDFSKDLEHLIQLGFDNVSLEPAVGPYAANAVKADDLPEVLAEYENLAAVLKGYRSAGRDVHFFHFNLNINRGPCLAKRLTGCGAGTEYLTVVPGGDIYPCHQLVEQPAFLMGNVMEDLDLREDIRKRFAGSNLTAKPVCQKCWARYYCGGGCHANAFFTNDDFLRPDSVSCEMHKKRIELALSLEASGK